MWHSCCSSRVLLCLRDNMTCKAPTCVNLTVNKKKKETPNRSFTVDVVIYCFSRMFDIHHNHYKWKLQHHAYTHTQDKTPPVLLHIFTTFCWQNLCLWMVQFQNGQHTNYYYVPCIQHCCSAFMLWAESFVWFVTVCDGVMWETISCMSAFCHRN